MKKYYMDVEPAFSWDEENDSIMNSIAENRSEGCCYEPLFLGTDKEAAIKLFKEKATFTVDNELEDGEEVVLVNALVEYECDEDGEELDGKEIDRYNLKVEYIDKKGKTEQMECVSSYGWKKIELTREDILESYHNRAEYPNSDCEYV